MTWFKILFSAILIAVMTTGCYKNLPTIGNTQTVKLANEWWVTFNVGGKDLFNTHVAFDTYNTAVNNDSLWLDDLYGGYALEFKSKVATDIKALTFSGAGVKNEYLDDTITVSKGQVFPNGGVSKTGIITDSIYMEVNFSDDPGNTYIISGTARTQYAEDDYAF